MVLNRLFLAQQQETDSCWKSNVERYVGNQLFSADFLFQG